MPDDPRPSRVAPAIIMIPDEGEVAVHVLGETALRIIRPARAVERILSMSEALLLTIEQLRREVGRVQAGRDGA